MMKPSHLFWEFSPNLLICECWVLLMRCFLYTRRAMEGDFAPRPNPNYYATGRACKVVV